MVQDAFTQNGICESKRKVKATHLRNRLLFQLKNGNTCIHPSTLLAVIQYHPILFFSLYFQKVLLALRVKHPV
jgi:hypothetical protein